MTEYFKVEKGDSPGIGTVAYRFEDFNIWSVDDVPENFETGHEKMSEGELVVELVKQQPGTLTDEAVDELRKEILNEYDIDISERVKDGVTLTRVLKNMTASWGTNHYKYKQNGAKQIL